MLYPLHIVLSFSSYEKVNAKLKYGCIVTMHSELADIPMVHSPNSPQDKNNKYVNDLVDHVFVRDIKHYQLIILLCFYIVNNFNIN